MRSRNEERRAWTTLPSGRVVLLSATRAKDRPWEVVRQGTYYVIAREKRGDSGGREIYSSPAYVPVSLDNLPDAEALAAALNARLSRRWKSNSG